MPALQRKDEEIFPLWASLVALILLAVLGVLSLVSTISEFSLIETNAIYILPIVLDLLFAASFFAIAIFGFVKCGKKDALGATNMAVLALPVASLSMAVSTFVGTMVLFAINGAAEFGVLSIIFLICFVLSAIFGFIAFFGKNNFKIFCNTSSCLLDIGCILLIGGSALNIVYQLCAILIGLMVVIGLYVKKQ